MERPKGVWISFLLMCATNALGVFLYSPSAHNGRVLVAISCVLVAIGYVVLYFYVKGRNWARWLVLGGSVLSLWNLKYLSHPSPSVTAVHAPMIVAEALIAVYLLTYLNTASVRAWFRNTKRRRIS